MMGIDVSPLGGLHEQIANETIANWLNARREWRTDAERVGLIQGANARPDIVLTQGDRMPVIVETEYGKPAVSDAKSRLGKILVNETRPFTEVIALGIDENVKNTTPRSLTELLEANERIFTVQFVSERGGDIRVWPSAPLPAKPADLIAYCEYAQVPQSVIEAKGGAIADSVKAAGRKLADGLRFAPKGGDASAALMKILGCDKPDAATQTACAIWMIAIDLQNDLATYSEKLSELGLADSGSLETFTKTKLLESWNIIRKVNYLPIVELAIPSLEAIPPRTVGLSDVLSELSKLTEESNGLHAKHIYNFAGELWQKLVVDREERAAHYTKPEVAELLATLGAVRFSRKSASELAKIDLMDAACGTGTLIGAGERALRRLYRLGGGENDELHRKRMENHIIAIDVNGIAGTLTAKRLTDMNVRQTYEGSKIAVTDHPAGSLTLLDPENTGISQVLGFWDVEQTADAHGNMGLFHVGIEEEGVDWALMNPPYSRPRAGREQATKNLGPLRAKAKRSGYALSNGQAGLASDFGNISLMRTKMGGVFAHVLPLTAAHAKSWQQWRQGIETRFENIVAIANVGEGLESMSSDTNMNEMLLVATKRKSNAGRKWNKTRILCVNLYSAPNTLSEGYALANEVAAIPDAENEGRSENFGFVRINTQSPGFPWYAVGNASLEFSALSAALMRGAVYDPILLDTSPLALDIKTLKVVCGAGPTHHLLGHLEGRDPRGAFEWTPASASGEVVSAHKSMWAAESKNQTRILASPTHDGHIMDRGLAKRMVNSRSRWFISRNLRWTSQALAVAHTANDSHGGRAWNALQEISDAVGRCVALFYNSVFGAIVRQVYGQSTQPGRAPIQVGGIEGLPCPDFGADTPEARRAREVAGARFDALSELELRPFAYCFADESRHRIDSAAAEMLGMDPEDPSIQEMLAHYRLLFASEPNVNGRQKRILAELDEFA